MSGRGSQTIAVSVYSLNLHSFLWHPSWVHWASSFISYLVELFTFKCCNLECLNKLSEYLKTETGLCSAVLVAVVVKCHH